MRQSLSRPVLTSDLYSGFLRFSGDRPAVGYLCVPPRPSVSGANSGASFVIARLTGPPPVKRPRRAGEAVRISAGEGARPVAGAPPLTCRQADAVATKRTQQPSWPGIHPGGKAAGAALQLKALLANLARCNGDPDFRCGAVAWRQEQFMPSDESPNSSRNAEYL